MFKIAQNKTPNPCPIQYLGSWLIRNKTTKMKIKITVNYNTNPLSTQPQMSNHGVEYNNSNKTSL